MKKTALFLIFLFSICIAKAQIEVRYITPSAINSWVNSYVSDHVVMYNTQNKSPKDKLVVTLTPDGHIPENMQIFDSVAAHLGFHVVGLSYTNSPLVNEICGDHTDPDCHKKVRNEILEAEGYANYVQVDSNNGIRQRLSQLIVHLNDSFPQENWGQYLVNRTTPNWSKILFVGYGESASQALFIATKYAISRAICLAGVPDLYKGNYANWINSSFRTEKKDLYHFKQESDSSLKDSNFFNYITASYTKDQASIEFDVNDNFHYARILNTNFITDNKKEIIGIDEFTPINKDGTPRFEGVWQYLLVNSKTSSINEIERDLKVYPNPATDKVFLQYPGLQTIKWELMDNSGRRILIGEGNEIDVNRIQSGFYFLNLEINNTKTVKKISITRQN